MSTGDDADHAATQMGRGEDGRSVRKKSSVPDSDSDDDSDEELTTRKKPAANSDDDADAAKDRALFQNYTKEKLKKRLTQLGLNTAGSTDARIQRLVEYGQYDRVDIELLRQEAKDRSLKPQAWNRKAFLIVALIADDENKTKPMAEPHPSFADSHPQEPAEIGAMMKNIGTSDLADFGLEEMLDPGAEVEAVGDVSPNPDEHPATKKAGVCSKLSLAGNLAQNDGVLIGGEQGEGAVGAAKVINRNAGKVVAKAGAKGYNSHSKGEGEFTDGNCVTCGPCNRNVLILNSASGGQGTFQKWNRHVDTSEHKQSLEMGFNRPQSDSAYIKGVIEYLKKDKTIVAKKKNIIKKHIRASGSKFECKDCGKTYKFKFTSTQLYLSYKLIKRDVLHHIDQRHS